MSSNLQKLGGVWTLRRRYGLRGSIFYLGEIAEVEGKDLWEGRGEKKGHTS